MRSTQQPHQLRSHIINTFLCNWQQILTLQLLTQTCDRMQTEVSDNRLATVNENILTTQVLVNHSFIMQVAHALGNLRGDVDCPVEIRFLVRFCMKVFVEAYAAAQAHDYGALGWLHARAHDQNQIGVPGFFEIEHFLFEVKEFFRVFCQIIVKVDFFDCMWTVPLSPEKKRILFKGYNCLNWI